MSNSFRGEGKKSVQIGAVAECNERIVFGACQMPLAVVSDENQHCSFFEHVIFSFYLVIIPLFIKIKPIKFQSKIIRCSVPWRFSLKQPHCSFLFSKESVLFTSNYKLFHYLQKTKRSSLR